MPLQEQYEAALARLIASGELNEAQAEAVRREFAGSLGAKGGWLAEVVAYAGGGLMIVGAAMYLGFEWDDLTKSSRLGILGGFMVALILAALLIAGKGGVRRAAGRRGRAAAVLLSVTAIPAAVFAGQLSPDYAASLGFGTGFGVAVIALAVRSNGFGIVLGAFMTGGAVITSREWTEQSWVVTGVLLIVAGAAWTAVALGGLLRPRPLALAAGVALALIGAQMPAFQGTSDVWAYSLTFGVAAACFALYRWDRSMVAVAGGILGVTIAVPQIVNDLTGDSINPGLIMLIGGAVLVLSSLLGIRLHRSARTSAAQVRSS